MLPRSVRFTRVAAVMRILCLHSPGDGCRLVAAVAMACALICLAPAGGVAQTPHPAQVQSTQVQSTQVRPAAEPNVFDRIGNWFDRQFSDMKSNMQDAREKFDRDTRKSLDAARDAVEAVSQLPDQRTVRGREVCALAPNGAPDCTSAAMRLCRSNGYASGKSLDSTTAENCPARVLLSGRQPSAGECKTETFISRALCTP
jgi:hypothetical protein